MDESSGSVNKTGMGSSAALITSLVGGIVAFCCSSISESPDYTKIVHNIAQCCHSYAQGKVRSRSCVCVCVCHTYYRCFGIDSRYFVGSPKIETLFDKLRTGVSQHKGAKRPSSWYTTTSTFLPTHPATHSNVRRRLQGCENANKKNTQPTDRLRIRRVRRVLLLAHLHSIQPADHQRSDQQDNHRAGRTAVPQGLVRLRAQPEVGPENPGYRFVRRLPVSHRGRLWGERYAFHGEEGYELAEGGAYVCLCVCVCCLGWMWAAVI